MSIKNRLSSINPVPGHWFSSWLERRVPASRRHSLRQKNLFIFPTSAGFGYLFVNVLIWLTGTNYENNLILALAYLQLSVFLVCIHHTFFNLSGIEIEAIRSIPGFVGRDSSITLKMSAPGRSGRFSIMLSVPGAGIVTVNAEAGGENLVEISVPLNRRGLQRLPRVLVESRFPLGLLRCWTWLGFDLEVLAYPAPVASPAAPFHRSGEESGVPDRRPQGDEFIGFRHYQPGQPVRDIAWKQFARANVLYSREYAEEAGTSRDLDWYETAGDVESRLSQLCYWVLSLPDTLPTGLRLPGSHIHPATGTAHRTTMLRSLALFETQP